MKSVILSTILTTTNHMYMYVINYYWYRPFPNSPHSSILHNMNLGALSCPMRREGSQSTLFVTSEPTRIAHHDLRCFVFSNEI